jgi:hypothetical protein
MTQQLIESPHSEQMVYEAKKPKLIIRMGESLMRTMRREETYIVLGASIVSIVAFLFFYGQGTTLGYKDMYSHLEIGRRVVVGQSTGFGQLGGIWLPLQHILMIPLVWNNFLYLTGLAGSLLSMAAYVTSVVAVFKIVRLLTGSRLGGYTAALVFGLNPGVLYLQSTALTELLMYAALLLAVLGVLKWLKTDNYNFLMLAAFSTFALTLTRYEGWVMAIVLVAVVVYSCIRRGFPFAKGDQKGQGLTLTFMFFALLGIVAWMVWNGLIFGDPMNWVKGEYSSSEQVSTQQLTQVGDLQASVMTYYYGMLGNMPVVLMIAAVAGLIVLFIREKFSPESVLVMSTIVIIPFFMYGLFTGQQPMRVAQIDGDLYNLRFGVFAVIPASIMIGYLVGQATFKLVRPVLAISAAVLVGAFFVVSFADNGEQIITQQEARSSINGMSEQAKVGDFLADKTRGRILMESFNNERALFEVQPRVVYEGAKFWDSALIDPTGARNAIDVIVMRTEPGNTDKVYDDLYEAPVMYEYNQVLETDHYRVYEKKGQLFSDEG